MRAIEFTNGELLEQLETAKWMIKYLSHKIDVNAGEKAVDYYWGKLRKWESILLKLENSL